MKIVDVTKVKRKKRKFSKGDLVTFISLDGNVVKGVIKGTPDDWWVCRCHYDVKGQIVPYQKIKMIKKGFITKGQMKYI